MPGVLEVLMASAREDHGVQASWREHLWMMLDFILIGRAEPWSL